MSIFKKEKDTAPDFVNETLRYKDRQFGDLKEGINETEHGSVNVNVVSRKTLKSEYQVGGVLDQEQNNNWKAWLYLAPALILMAIFLIYPLINTFAISFIKDYSQIEGKGTGFTFDNFAEVLGLKQTSSGGVESSFISYYLLNTFIIVIVTVPVSIFIALMIAVLLNNLKWLQKTYQIVFFLPYVTNAIAVGMVFTILFDKKGLINNIFGLGEFNWLYDTSKRWIMMIPLCINIVWKSIPFKILILLSGLQNVDKQYYNAAKIDAAPQWKVLTRITVPALSPQILYLMVTSFIGAFKEYTAVIGMFGENADKNVKTVVFYIYEKMKTPSTIGLASAAAVVLFVIILLITFLQLWLSKKKVQY